MACRTIGDALLADIIAHPGDDTPRLIFADWLEENGDPVRAEFIRNAILRGGRGPVPVASKDRGILPHVGGMCREWHFDAWQSGFKQANPFAFVLRRGFVCEVKASLKRLLRYGPDICRTQPIEHMIVCDKKPEHVDRGPGYDPWTFYVGDANHESGSAQHVPDRVWRRMRKTWWPCEESILTELNRVTLEICREMAAKEEEADRWNCGAKPGASASRRN